MTKSLLYAVNPTDQAVTTGDAINFGSIVRRLGNNLEIIGGNVLVTGQGFYKLTANISFQATGIGNATVTLMKNGIPIEGATASMTFADTGTYSVTIPCVIREFSCITSTISAVFTGVNATITDASIVAERV